MQDFQKEFYSKNKKEQRTKSTMNRTDWYNRRTWSCYPRKNGCGNYISKTSAYTDEALAWTTAGGPVPPEAATDWEETVPDTLVVEAMGGPVMADDPVTITEGELDTETKGVTGTGLVATPDTVGEMLELTEEIAGVSAWERPAASVGWGAITDISVCVPWVASFWACSRANCKQIYKVRLKAKISSWKKIGGERYEWFNLQFFWHGPLWFLRHLIVIVPIPTMLNNLECMLNHEDQSMKHTKKSWICECEKRQKNPLSSIWSSKFLPHGWCIGPL